MRDSISIILLCLLVLPTTSWSATRLVGQVSMRGSIIESACAIALARRDQSIDIPVLPREQFMRDGGGPTWIFNIRMVGCNLAHANQQERPPFSVTFDGATSNDGLFSVHDQGRGGGLQIAGEGGYAVRSGQQMPVKLLPENGLLNYTLRLVADRSLLRAGPYRATIRFKLDYY